MRILFVCTGNSCRSQMAEGILKSLHEDWEVFSAGLRPEKEITIYTQEVMQEAGFDLSGQFPKDIKLFEGKEFDYLITLSENARIKCKNFNGNVKNILHFNINDPFEARGSNSEILTEYKKTRNEIFKIIENIEFK